MRENKMKFSSLLWMLSSAVLLSATSVHATRVYYSEENGVKTGVYLLPPFFQTPGSVIFRYYYDVDFPRGHIGIKSFKAELVDGDGNPILLSDAYLHHWLMYSYYGRKDVQDPFISSTLNLTNIIPVWNNGPCQGTILRQTYAMGSETRKTRTDVPDPYALQFGNPAEIPEGYELRWMLNIHSIDTREVADKMGCTECRCALYNVTSDKYGIPYTTGAGNSNCCSDRRQCALRQGIEKLVPRKLFVRYTVIWVDWTPRMKPVQVYIFDVTDTGMRVPGNEDVGCQAEYSIPACTAEERARGPCIHTKKTNGVLPRGGTLVYGVGHLHAGGVAIALYGEDGRVICRSLPYYGNGTEPGNEAGYLVGMSACYPEIGTVTIGAGEVLTVAASYENTRSHTGIMGHFYVLIEEPPLKKAIDPDSESKIRIQ